MEIHSTLDGLKLIIKEKFDDKDLFFLDPNGDIRWVTYNPDSSAGGQFIDITFSQDMLRKAYASEEKIDEFILSHCSASLIDTDKDKAEFINYADYITQRDPDWNDFQSVIKSIMPDVEKNIKISLPTITCNYSDSPVLENKKTYSIYEFVKLVKQADEEFIASKLPDYQSRSMLFYEDDSLYDYIRHMGYDRIKFTVNMPDGTAVTEYMDLGNDYGDGNVIDWLKLKGYTDIASQLEKSCSIPKAIHSLEENALLSINQVNNKQTPLESYSIRVDENFSYVGYKDNKKDTDAERYFHYLFERNPEYAKKQIIDNSLKKGFISDFDYVEAACIIMTDEEKAAHIHAVETAMSQNDIISKSDHRLHEQFIMDYTNSIAEYKNGNKGPYSNITNSKNAGHSQVKAPVIYKPKGRR